MRKEAEMLARVVVASDRRYVEGLISRLTGTMAIAGVVMIGAIMLAVPVVLRR
jgi:hypothetical protein